ncbi:hypothetical protein [Tenacibaculum ovolyticum]|uniref:hypothetical protein n=1 Tax=Tenacibaculum ovolyticum TaxID=104270 RepID=UPI000AC039B9|nr:hypothetical protein [Tenacibaculum ovolyticum]
MMNQGYQKEEFTFSREEKKKSIIIPDDTGNDEGKPKPDTTGKSTQEVDEEEVDE